MRGQPFVVADGAAIVAEPGEGPLDDPSAGQDLEGVRQPPTDDRHPIAKRGGCPADQLACIGGIGPHQADAALRTAQPP